MIRCIKNPYLTLLKGGTNRKHDKERNVLKDLSRDKPNPRSNPANPYKHHVYMKGSVYDKRYIENSVSNQSFCWHVPKFEEDLYKYCHNPNFYLNFHST